MSIKRLEEFLDLEELDPDNVQRKSRKNEGLDNGICRLTRIASKTFYSKLATLICTYIWESTVAAVEILLPTQRRIKFLNWGTNFRVQRSSKEGYHVAQ